MIKTDGYTLAAIMRKARRRCRFTATEQALFYELVAICNSENWCETFLCSNTELCLSLSISEKTLIKARESLINAQLIYYKSGKSKRNVGTYSFTKPLEATTVNFTADTTAPVTVNATDYIKGKTETETKINIAFNEFWNLYDKKRGDKAKLEIKWNKLTAKDREDIMNYIPKYITSTPDKQFRKDPRTFLNNRSWEDELIISENENEQNIYIIGE